MKFFNKINYLVTNNRIIDKLKVLKCLHLDYRVKAGALQFTMFIVVVIALLLSTFVLLLHTHKTFGIQTDLTLETISNMDKGIKYALENEIRLKDTVTVFLQDESYKTLKVHQGFWGVFGKVTAVSKIKNKTFKKIALVGASQPKVNRTALYLEEQNRPLVVVGNTKIQGDVYLPKQGVRTGNILGHSYYGNQLIYGNTKTSQTLPKLQQETMNQIKNISNVYKAIDSDRFLDLNVKRVHSNSFYNLLQVVYSKDIINLSGARLTGHIIVQSETKIIVDATSNLKDVILVAPNIQIKNHSKGTFQAFAAKEITVGNHCKLNYPSALVLKENMNVTSLNTNNPAEDTPFIKIHSSSDIRGAVVYFGATKNYKPQVLIDKSTTIIGEVYCNRNIELLGQVHGTVFTSGFVANQSGSVYQNHIYNGTIKIDNLAQEYMGLSLKESKKGIAKWLY